MPISKKDRIHREHKKVGEASSAVTQYNSLTVVQAEAAGTRVPVKANGNPVKAPKAKSTCTFCKKELVRDNLKQMEDHAGTHSAMWTKEKCFPNDFAAAPEPAAKATTETTA